MNLLTGLFERKTKVAPPPPSAFPVAVVGESSYQDNLIRIFGKPRGDGVNTVVTAQIILEDSNPYDNQAVRIDVNKMTVGYLSKANARKYRKAKPELYRDVQANVRGGWNRRGDIGQYGVWLQIPELEK